MTHAAATRNAEPADSSSRESRRPILRVPLVAHSSMAVDSGRLPLRFGVPLPRGRLTSAHDVVVSCPGGDPQHAQSRALAHWGDGSIKWLLVESFAPRLQVGANELTVGVSTANSAARTAGDELPVVIRRESATISGSQAEFTLASQETTSPIQVTAGGGHWRFEIELCDSRGRRRRARLRRMKVASVGPHSAVLEGDGDFGRRTPLRFTLQLRAHQGSGLARLELALVNPRRARHRGGLWDLGDAGSYRFRELAVRIFPEHVANCVATWRATPHDPWQSAGDDAIVIYQDSSGGENWNSQNHVNAAGDLTCRFRGYRVRHEPSGRETRGLRASPTGRLAANGTTFTAAIPEFWQQFPKSISVGQRGITLGLFPASAAEPFELQGGEQKTHIVWFDFAEQSDRPQPPDSLRWVHEPVHIACDPAWIEETKAVDPFVAGSHTDQGDHLGELAGAAVDGPESLSAKREVIDEYGWRHFGDAWADHESQYYEGPPPIISHYNNQFDLLYGAILHGLASGDPAWRGIYDPLARHVLDIDLYHTRQDKAAYNGGLFWHTDHYVTAATCGHRTFSRANKPANRPYGGGPSNEHNYTTGLLHYYYLTGDDQARRAVLQLARWVIDMDDGRKSVLAMIDQRATGLASRTAQDDYHGPGRGAANSINALLDAWRLSRQCEYMAKTDELIRRCIHPADDIDSRNLLDVERRWSYTVFLTVLSRYVDLKVEHHQFDEMLHYARESLLHYGRWMLENERHYFDHADQLEYPTVTWAAQELRKANVLRMAARHAPEGLAQQMRERADQFSRRSWSDLRRFETRHDTRVRAILLTEGLRERDLRRVAGAAVAGDSLRESIPQDFGPPRPFIPQRLAVSAQLRSPLGFAKACLSALRYCTFGFCSRRLKVLGSRPGNKHEIVKGTGADNARRPASQPGDDSQ